MQLNHINSCIQITQPHLMLSNPFVHDKIIQSYCKWMFQPQQLSKIYGELENFGLDLIKQVHQWEIDCERNQPKLIQYDVYGKVIDQIVVGEGWKNQRIYAAKEGIVALAYERNEGLGELQRFLQLIRLSLYSPSSGLYSCPLAMTDGAAFILQNWLRNPTNDDKATLQFVQEAYSRLTSRDPNRFWTCGQWMTEKKGGSDVQNAIETIAVHQGNNLYKLYGYKWFSSATDSDISITLGRIVSGKAQVEQNINKIPLSLFILKVRGQDGQLNGIKIVGLKDKLGTRQLPTAELILDGTEAYLVGQIGKGVKDISQMLNVTRLYNSATSVGAMRRMYQIVLDYSNKRQAFGHKLSDLPLHQTSLIQFSINLQANSLAFLKISLLFSKIQFGTATEHEQDLFRMLIPLLKLYTAKQTMKWMSEGLEQLGALGYMENSNIPVTFRDAQVLTIWEGTTNVLSLDFLRSLQVKRKNSIHMLNVYQIYFRQIIMNAISSESKIPDQDLQYIQSLAKITMNHNALITDLHKILTNRVKDPQRNIREISFIFFENFIAIEFLDKFNRDGRERDLLMLKLWVDQMHTYKHNQSQDDKLYRKIVGKDIELIQQDQTKAKL